jgi:hypothetical protein
MLHFLTSLFSALILGDEKMALPCCFIFVLAELSAVHFSNYHFHIFSPDPGWSGPGWKEVNSEYREMCGRGCRMQAYNVSCKFKQNKKNI